MIEKDKNLSTGIVIEALPNATFRVQLEDNKTMLGYLSGKMRKFRIKVLVGDRVTLESSPHDPSKGRITKRL